MPELPAAVRELAARVRNWGRWGPEDELGTLNLIDAAAVRRGAAEIRTGRCIPLGISTSLTSTTETLMPHGDVASSMIDCRIALILSRSERSSSSTCWPRTDRRVVCAICEVATM